MPTSAGNHNAQSAADRFRAAQERFQQVTLQAVRFERQDQHESIQSVRERIRQTKPQRVDALNRRMKDAFSGLSSDYIAAFDDAISAFLEQEKEFNLFKCAGLDFRTYYNKRFELTVDEIVTGTTTPELTHMRTAKFEVHYPMALAHKFERFQSEISAHFTQLESGLTARALDFANGNLVTLESLRHLLEATTTQMHRHFTQTCTNFINQPEPPIINPVPTRPIPINHPITIQLLDPPHHEDDLSSESSRSDSSLSSDLSSLSPPSSPEPPFDEPSQFRPITPPPIQKKPAQPRPLIPVPPLRMPEMDLSDRPTPSTMQKPDPIPQEFWTLFRFHGGTAQAIATRIIIHTRSLLNPKTTASARIAINPKGTCHDAERLFNGPFSYEEFLSFYDPNRAQNTQAKLFMKPPFSSCKTLPDKLKMLEKAVTKQWQTLYKKGSFMAIAHVFEDLLTIRKKDKAFVQLISRNKENQSPNALPSISAIKNYEQWLAQVRTYTQKQHYYQRTLKHWEEQKIHEAELALQTLVHLRERIITQNQQNT